jgi:nucleotide-binding universal stress UspA family protein
MSRSPSSLKRRSILKSQPADLSPSSNILDPTLACELPCYRPKAHRTAMGQLSSIFGRSKMSWLYGKCIVAPTDFSEESVASLDWARSVIDRPQHLHVVHVSSVDVMGDPSLPRRSVADQLMENLTDDPAFEGVQHKVLLGDPGTQITKYAEQVNADLIAIPSHGRSGLAHLLLGSVAERVVQCGHCPVLVLRKKT